MLILVEPNQVRETKNRHMILDGSLSFMRMHICCRNLAPYLAQIPIGRFPFGVSGKNFD